MGMLGMFLGVLIGLLVIGVALVQLDLVDLSLGKDDGRARNVTSLSFNNKTQVSFVLAENPHATTQTRPLVKERRAHHLPPSYTQGGRKPSLCGRATQWPSRQLEPQLQCARKPTVLWQRGYTASATRVCTFHQISICGQ